MDLESGMDFDFDLILKSIQAIEIRNKRAAEELNIRKEKSEELKKKLAAELVKCEDEDFKTKKYNSEISLFEEKLRRKNADIDAQTKRIEDNHVQTENVKWRQSKAKLVLESERARRQMYQAIKEKRIAEDAPKMEPELGGSQLSAAAAERALKKEELDQRQEFLEKEISKIQNVLEEKKKTLSNISSEASVLKKRNSAVLLRLRRKLQESEGRRLELMTSGEQLREMAKRGRPRYGARDSTQFSDWRYQH